MISPTLPIPPLPHFPSSQLDAISSVSKLIDNYALSLFEEPPSPHTQQNHLDRLNASLRVEFLIREALEKSLKQAEKRYSELQSQLQEIREANQCQWLTSPISLPPELIPNICKAVERNYGIVDLPEDFGDALKRWGNFLFASTTVDLSIRDDDTESRWEKILAMLDCIPTTTKLDVAILSDSPKILTSLLQRPHPWKVFSLFLNALGEQSTVSILHDCRSKLYQVEEMKIYCSCTQDTDLHETFFVPSAFPVIDGQFAPKVVEVPLTCLSIFQRFTHNILHLTLVLPVIPGNHGFDSGTFGSLLQGNNLDSLRTLKLIYMGGDDDMAQLLFTTTMNDFFLDGPTVRFPSLVRLTVVFPLLDVNLVTAIFKRIACPNLRHLSLTNLFCPVPSWVEMVTRGMKERLPTILRHVDEICPKIDQLSFYSDFDALDTLVSGDDDPQSPQSMPHTRQAILDSLVAPSTGAGPVFPDLCHISIPFDCEEDFLDAFPSLVSFLQSRKDSGASPIKEFIIVLPSIKISPETRTWVEKLSLYVHDIVISALDVQTLENIFPGSGAAYM